MSVEQDVENRFITYSDDQLTYIGQECKKIPLILGKVYGRQTRRLDLSFNGLTSLAGLELFFNLEELILDNNFLSDDVKFIFLPSLKTLSLNKNQFRDLDKLIYEVSKNFPHLQFLSLLGNKACPNQLSSRDKDDEDYKRYRFYVVNKLANLKFLDSKKITKSEKREAVLKGSLMRIVRPSPELFSNPMEAQCRSSPLPAIGEKTHSGQYGQLRHKYLGKYSEGNRFIRNHDL